MSLSIKVFDTILSTEKSGDSTSRNSADFWKVYCFASGWGFNYERIHSLKDVEHFFCNTKIKEEVIIFSGHGYHKNDETLDEGFHLSNDDLIDGNHDFEVSKKNYNKIVIFSSCLIGKNKKLSEQLKQFFNAQSLFAYRHEIQDRFCFLNESILLTLIDHVNEEKGKTFTENNFEKFQEQTSFMKTINKKHAKTHPMVMY